MERAHSRSDQNAEHRLDLFGRVEVALLAEWIARAPVISEVRIVERRFHEPAERDRTLAADLVAQNFGERAHGSTTRLCGVRMNISIR